MKSLKFHPIVLMVLISSCPPCFGQSDEDMVPFVAYWSIGDSYDFKVTHIKKRWELYELEDGKITASTLTKNDSTSYHSNFLVIDSSETSYTVKWSYDTQLEDFGFPENISDQWLKDKVTEVIYKTDELGVLIEIENWKEVSEYMMGLIATLVDQYTPKKNRKNMMAMLEPFIEKFSSQEVIETLCFQELQGFHMLLGGQYPSNEVMLYEDEITNVFSEDPIRANVQLYVDSVDFENQYCKMIQESKINDKDVKEMLANVFKQMNLNDDDELQAMKKARYDITDNNIFEYYYYPGIPINIEYKREVIVDVLDQKARSIDITTIELIE